MQLDFNEDALDNLPINKVQQIVEDQAKMMLQMSMPTDIESLDDNPSQAESYRNSEKSDMFDGKFEDSSSMKESDDHSHRDHDKDERLSAANTSNSNEGGECGYNPDSESGLESVGSQYHDNESQSSN